MNKILIILSIVLLASCGPSAEEKRQVEIEQQRIEKETSEKLAQEKADRVAAVTCSIMSETRNMDRAVRVEKMNEAREKIGEQPFLRGDDAIKEAFEYGLCQALVLNENYDERLQPFRDAKREEERIAAEQLRIRLEKRAEEDRIAAEKKAEQDRIAAEKQKVAEEKKTEERRIAAEKQKIADSKPTVKETFHRGKLRTRRTHQPKIDGGKRHGPSEVYHGNGQLEEKGNFKDGEADGPFETYYHTGELRSKYNYKDGKKDGPQSDYHRNGQLEWRRNYKDGKKDGRVLEYRENGNKFVDLCYRNDAKVKRSLCKK